MGNNNVKVPEIEINCSIPVLRIIYSEERDAHKQFLERFDSIHELANKMLSIFLIAVTFIFGYFHKDILNWMTDNSNNSFTGFIILIFIAISITSLWNLQLPPLKSFLELYDLKRLKYSTLSEKEVLSTYILIFRKMITENSELYPSVVRNIIFARLSIALGSVLAVITLTTIYASYPSCIHVGTSLIFIGVYIVLKLLIKEEIIQFLTNTRLSIEDISNHDSILNQNPEDNLKT